MFIVYRILIQTNRFLAISNLLHPKRVSASKLWFSTISLHAKILEIINSVRSNSFNLNHQRLWTPLGFKDIGIRKLQSVAKTHFPCSDYRRQPYFKIELHFCKKKGILYQLYAMIVSLQHQYHLKGLSPHTFRDSLIEEERYPSSLSLSKDYKDIDSVPNGYDSFVSACCQVLRKVIAVVFLYVAKYSCMSLLFF